jgi:hypothetical protein
MNTWSEYVEKELLREEIGPYQSICGAINLRE